VQSMQVGTLPQNSLSVPWRSTAYAQDAKAPLVTPLTNILGTTHDSSGGWMTGGPGGNIKMTQPTAFTTMMLAWGVIAFPNGYLGSRPAAMNSIQVTTARLLNEPTIPCLPSFSGFPWRRSMPCHHFRTHVPSSSDLLQRGTVRQSC
jgi:hypothetical protein